MIAFLSAHRGERFSVEQVAAGAGLSDEIETVFKVLQHLAANPDHRVSRSRPAGGGAFSALYGRK